MICTGCQKEFVEQIPFRARCADCYGIHSHPEAQPCRCAIDHDLTPAIRYSETCPYAPHRAQALALRLNLPPNTRVVVAGGDDTLEAPVEQKEREKRAFDIVNACNHLDGGGRGSSGGLFISSRGVGACYECIGEALQIALG